MADDSLGVRIGAEQMYAQLQALATTVTRIDAKLDALAQQSHQLDDHESRLRDLESRRLPHSVLNILAAVGATVALIWQAAGH
jgi:prefoldin subunit 5